MQNISETLDKVVALQERAGNRAVELYYAQLPSAYGHGYLYNVSPDKYEFDVDSIEVTLEESCREPERTTITLGLFELEMTDEKWEKYIAGVKENTAKVLTEREQKKKEADLEKKKKELERLQQQVESLKTDLGA